jgi:enoyl-CoA hydratase
MSYEKITYQPGPVARVILNRPERLNAQSFRLLEEMDDAFKKAAADQEVRAVVLSGAGRSFSAGHDLDSPEAVEDRKQREEGEDRFTLGERFKRLYIDMHLDWRNLPKPTIAMVHGYCIYGGWMIAAAMDVIFAAEDALFIPTYGDYFTTSWDVGARKAKEILFSNTFMTAQEAMEWGFVNRVYPADELEEETLRYASRVASNDSSSLRTIKFAINQTLDMMGFSTSVQAVAPSLYGRQFQYREAPQRPPGAAPNRPFRNRVQQAMQYLSEDRERRQQ